jgi:MSHA biogenesis protein MshJ
MKLPANIEKRFSQFDSLTLRERALLTVATLIALIMIWTIAVFDRQHSKERFLLGEMDSINSAIASAGQSINELTTSDPTTVALAKEKQLQAELSVVNEQLASRSGGLIEPERMVQVIHDVLAHQRGVALISLQNKAVTNLVPPLVATATTAPADGHTEETPPATDAAAAAPPPPAGGPYVHTVELVVEGQYLDILDYLRALEALPWRFNWKVLELQTQRYPLNRVTIELTTLSMDKDWIGV